VTEDVTNPLVTEFSNRHNDALRLHRLLGQQSRRESSKAGVAKVLVVILGAITAAQGAAKELFSTTTVTWMYVIVGVLTATTAGLLAAFKWDERATRMKALVPTVHSLEHRADLDANKHANGQLDKFDEEIEALAQSLMAAENEAAKVGVILPSDMPESRRKRRVERSLAKVAE
jgi:hypothetical protein